MRCNSTILVAIAFTSAACGLAGCERRVEGGPRANATLALEIRKSLASSKGAEKADAEEGRGADESTGWATLRGTFRFVGSPPQPRPISVDKDPEFCGKHNLKSEEVVVAGGGYLQNAVIFLRTKAPVHESYNASAKDTKVLDNRNCRFEPHVGVLRTSQTLIVKNSDPVAHNSNLRAPVNGDANPIIPANTEITQTFTKEEPQPVKVGCNIHPWMGAWIFVRANPYAAVSNAQGQFVLENVPAGKELEFQLWQEKVAGLKGTEIAGLKVDTKGRFKIKLNPGEDKTIEIRVPEAVLR